MWRIGGGNENKERKGSPFPGLVASRTVLRTVVCVKESAGSVAFTTCVGSHAVPTQVCNLLLEMP